MKEIYKNVLSTVFYALRMESYLPISNQMKPINKNVLSMFFMHCTWNLQLFKIKIFIHEWNSSSFQ